MTGTTGISCDHNTTETGAPTSKLGVIAINTTISDARQVVELEKVLLSFRYTINSEYYICQLIHVYKMNTATA